MDFPLNPCAKLPHLHRFGTSVTRVTRTVNRIVCKQRQVPPDPRYSGCCIWRLTLTRALKAVGADRSLPRTLDYCLSAHKFPEKVSHLLKLRFGRIQWKVPIEARRQAIQLGGLLGRKFRGAASQALSDDVK